MRTIDDCENLELQSHTKGMIVRIWSWLTFHRSYDKEPEIDKGKESLNIMSITVSVIESMRSVKNY